jgi:hypothetical protein
VEACYGLLEPVEARDPRASAAALGVDGRVIMGKLGRGKSDAISLW